MRFTREFGLTIGVKGRKEKNRENDGGEEEEGMQGNGNEPGREKGSKVMSLLYLRVYE